FSLKNVSGKPKPWSNGQPLLMSAGSSPQGRKFAAEQADCLFMAIGEETKLAADVSQVRAMSGDRNIGLYTSGHLICRPTARETKEYYHYLVHETGDREAAENVIAKRTAGESKSI